MLKIDEIKLPVGSGQEAIRKVVARRLQVKAQQLGDVKIIRQAIDARKKPDLRLALSVAVDFRGNEEKKLRELRDKRVSKYQPVKYVTPTPNYGGSERPIVVGAGPAGIFCGLLLAEAGLEPLILERGKAVQERGRDVARFWRQAELLPDSNVQFGEGGAGAFSDGKLYTGTKDPRHRRIIADFIAAGAPEEIGYLAQPHIGSDNLPQVVVNLRQRIEALGGQFCFSTRLSDIITTNKALVAIKTVSPQGEEVLDCSCLVLATGHSARDTYEMLWRRGVALEPKGFSLGVRIEHSQSLINQAQYGTDALGAANYKLALHLPNGRSVYTFCMCPGGVVVGAASEPQAIVTNGMSGFARDGKNANSALLVGVTPADFPTSHPLGGMYWQRQIEQAGYTLGGSCYKAPCQKVGDFLRDQPSTAWSSVEPTYLPGVSMGAIGPCLPDFARQSLRAALPLLAAKLPGFDSEDALLTGPETRSSAPVRIIRDQKGEANIKGLFLAGEGPGYAGGIMSAAADGLCIGEFVLNFRK